MAAEHLAPGRAALLVTASVPDPKGVRAGLAPFASSADGTAQTSASGAAAAAGLGSAAAASKLAPTTLLRSE